MRFLSVVVSVALAAAPNPHRPTDEQRRQLLKQIDAAVKKEKDYRAVEVMRQSLLLSIRNGTASARDYADLEVAVNRLDVLRREVADAMSDVMKTTTAAYGIVPDAGAGPIANGPLQGSKVEFKPKYLRQGGPSFEGPIFNVRDDLHGKARYMRLMTQPTDLGYTFEDGSVYVLFPCLERAVREKNPGIVALTIYHEAVHFSELVTVGWKTHEEAELSAYEREVAVIDAFSLTAKELAYVKDRVVSLKTQVKAGQALPGVFLSSPFPTAEQELQNFRDWDKDAEEIHSTALQQGAALKYLNRWRDDAQRLQQSTDEQALRAHIAYIQSLAERSCSRPGSVAREDLERLSPWPAEAYKKFTVADMTDSPCSVRLAQMIMSRLAAREMPGIHWLKIEAASAKEAYSAYVAERARLEIELSFKLQREQHEAQMRVYLDVCARMVRLTARNACAGLPYAVDFGLFEQAVGALVDHGARYAIPVAAIVEPLSECSLDMASWAMAHRPGLTYESFSSELRRLQAPPTPVPGPVPSPAPAYSPPYSEQPRRSIDLPTLPQILGRLR